MQLPWILSRNVCLAAGLLLCITYGADCQSLVLDVQRQQLPFGALVFPIPDRFESTSSNETHEDSGSNILNGLRVDLPKITAMADCHTDDGSVISRHYSATLVESAWRNRLNNSTMAFLLENTSVDASVLSFFIATYLSSIMVLSVTRIRSV